MKPVSVNSFMLVSLVEKDHSHVFGLY